MLIKLTPWQIFNLVLNGQPVYIREDQKIMDANEDGFTRVSAIQANEPAIQDYIHHKLLEKLISPLGITLDTGRLLFGLRHKVVEHPDHSLTIKD